MSKPRIFVSSTYYDLKFVRERIENFINDYCFEPILFESDNVFFHPNKNLDTSCYNEVSNCHMMILIIGGRYGSLATTENKEQKKDNYEQQYVSITRKEYETAINKGIPVMIFIEQNVYTEYRTYQTNKDTLPPDFKFAYVDDIRVFEFISFLDQNAIKQFNKVDEIEHYFANQVSGMMLSYLLDLQREKESKEIKAVVNEINVLSQSMQVMLNSIGEKVLGREQDRYKALLAEQNRVIIDFFIGIFDENTSWDMVDYSSEDLCNIPIDDICKILMTTLFNKQKIDNVMKEEDMIKRYYLLRLLVEQVIEDMQNESKSVKIRIKISSPSNFISQLSKVVQLINQDSELKQYFEMRLKEIINNGFNLPF